MTAAHGGERAHPVTVSARPSDAARVIAGVAAALMLAVVGASAYLRLAQHGIDCLDAADCVRGEPSQRAAGTAVTAARLVHRVAATGVGLVLIALTAAIARRRPRSLRSLVYAVTTLVLVLVLALIGARSAESEATAPSAAIAFTNLTGGLALLALVWRLRVEAASPALALHARSRFVARVALAAAAAWIACDAAVATGFAVDAFGGARARGAGQPSHSRPPRSPASPWRNPSCAQAEPRDGWARRSRRSPPLPSQRKSSSRARRGSAPGSRTRPPPRSSSARWSPQPRAHLRATRRRRRTAERDSRRVPSKRRLRSREASRLAAGAPA